MLLSQLILLQSVFGCALAERPIVTTRNGRVQGIEIETFKGRTVFAYLSVPYASSPVGRRFEEMKRPAPWSGLRDCGKPSPSCLNLDNTGRVNGVEDCLFLNVYTPVAQIKLVEPLPVIVFIHGGAYHSFSGSIFGPRYLLDKNVVLVTFNFRIGVLGFLSSGDNVLPGNLGLKDQVLALRWVQSNIHFFGGNPSSVTLYGMSSGASMVLLHFFSPLSRNLFHRAYASGGSPLTPWAFQKNARGKLLSLAQHFNCPVNSTFGIVSCLERVTPEALASSLKALQIWREYYPVVPVGPVVDASSSSSPFLYEYPYESLYSCRVYNVPLVISDAYNSGGVPFAYGMDSNSILSLLNSKWATDGQYYLDFTDSLPNQYLNVTLARVKQYYFGRSVVNYSDLPSFFKMLSDRQYLSGTAKTAALSARCLAKVHLFIFNYRGSLSTSMSYGSPVSTHGASHVDDTLYLLNISSDVSRERSSKDVEMIDTMTNMLEIFSRTGVPSFGQNVTWRPINRGVASVYGDIPLLQVDGPGEFKMISRRNFGNNELWDVLPLDEPWAGRIV